MSTDLNWFRSSYSGDQGGNCVEVAIVPSAHSIHVRDSKDVDIPSLELSPHAWAAFVARIG